MNKKNLKKLLSNSGIKNFFWPTDRTFVERVNHNLLHGFSFLSSKSDELHATLPIIQKWVIPEALKIIEAIKLKEISKKRDLFISIKDYPLFKKLIDKKLPDYRNNFLLYLNKEPKDMNVPFLIKRVIRTSQKNSLGQLINIKTKNDYSLEPNELTLTNAQRKKIPLVYTNIKRFLRFDYSNQKVNPKLVKQLLDLIISNIIRELNTKSKKIEKSIILYLKRLIEESINITLNNVKNIEKEKNCNNLWVGSSGANYFVKLICHTLRRKDYRIFAHSHGSGYSMVNLLHTFHVVELNTCDEFYTERNINIDVLNDEINPGYLSSMKKPVIKGVNKEKIEINKIKYKKKIKKVMYIATAYKSERLRFVPVESDATYIDHQLRLLSFLKKKNLEIFYKPHPEGSLKFDKELSDFMNITLLEGLFEKLKIDVDAYVIDWCCTSLLATLLRKNKPIYFLNFSYPKLRNNSEKLLRKRMYFVESKLDLKNRIITNWDNFSDLLNIQQHEFSDEFLNTFF